MEVKKGWKGGKKERHGREEGVEGREGGKENSRGDGRRNKAGKSGGKGI